MEGEEEEVKATIILQKALKERLCQVRGWKGRVTIILQKALKGKLYKVTEAERSCGGRRESLGRKGAKEEEMERQSDNYPAEGAEEEAFIR